MGENRDDADEEEGGSSLANRKVGEKCVGVRVRREGRRDGE